LGCMLQGALTPPSFTRNILLYEKTINYFGADAHE